MYHNVVHNNLINCCEPKQGNSANFNIEIVLRYACFVSKPFPLAKTSHRLVFVVGSSRLYLNLVPRIHLKSSVIPLLLVFCQCTIV